jgi:hypothetical protein
MESNGLKIFLSNYKSINVKVGAFFIGVKLIIFKR